MLIPSPIVWLLHLQTIGEGISVVAIVSAEIGNNVTNERTDDNSWVDTVTPPPPDQVPENFHSGHFLNNHREKSLWKKLLPRCYYTFSF